MKKFKIAFYVHHHGHGHLMRTLQIASKLSAYEVILLGSDLSFAEGNNNLKNVRFIHLPMDVDEAKSEQAHNVSQHQTMRDDAVPVFHYAPLNVKGISERVAIMTSFFNTASPLILVVDVSVEVTLLARLCGIPTIVMRQHGHRTDLPHQMAYQSAALLLAPYPETLYQGEKDWAYHKTYFSGGFSRFDKLREVDVSQADLTFQPEIGAEDIKVAILIGGGGTSIAIDFVHLLARQCPKITFHILGKKQDNGTAVKNLIWEGHLENPSAVINNCEIVIGNTGHNTVMEVASLNKRFVGIPETRPFDEQLAKAEAIQSRKGIRVVHPTDLIHTKWDALLQDLLLEQVDWNGVIVPNAVQGMADAIINTGEGIFP